MLLRNHAVPFTKDRLCAWHAALFPTGRSDFHEKVTGAWRATQMQVVSGPHGKQQIHFLAPPPETMESEMSSFFAWWENGRERMDGSLRAALAHLYFVTIHSIDDGNGVWRAPSQALLWHRMHAQNNATTAFQRKLASTTAPRWQLCSLWQGSRLQSLGSVKEY